MTAHFRNRGLLAALADGASPAALLAELNASFGTFKASNQAKIDALNTALDEMSGQSPL